MHVLHRRDFVRTLIASGAGVLWACGRNTGTSETAAQKPAAPGAAEPPASGTGRIVVEPQFDEAAIFSEGLASVRTGARYGYIDTSGTIVIPAKFDFSGAFSDGLA